jgi:hypothetical protein
MSVQIKYTTIMRDFKGRFDRSLWFRNRIPTEEYFIHTPSSNDEDGWDIDDNIETTVTIWTDDAEKIVTEFWFRFP